MIRNGPRPWRAVAATAVVVACLLGAGMTPAGAAAGSGGTPIMGQATVTASQIAAWYDRSGKTPDLPLSIAELASLYLEEGAAEGVRGDLAFAQAVLETGHFTVWGDVPPGANNYAGIGATGGGVPGHVFATPRLGVRAHIQHLRFLADPTATPERLAHPPESRWWVVKPAGKAPTVEQLSGCTWACDPDYAAKVLSVYRSLGGSAEPPAAASGIRGQAGPATASGPAAAVDPRLAPRMPDGLVVRDAGRRVWWLDDGAARRIRSAAILSSWGIRPPRVVAARPGEIARRRPGPALDWRPGALLRLPDGRVTLYDGEELRPIPDAATLAARGHDRAAILAARPGDVAGIPIGAPLDGAELVPGEVVRFGEDPTVYEVAADGLLSVDADVLVYARYGGGGGSAVATRPADTPRPEVVGTVAFRDGTALRTPDGRVWLVSGGRRRHVPSPDALKALALPAGAVLAVEEDLAARHDVGAPLPR